MRAKKLFVIAFGFDKEVLSGAAALHGRLAQTERAHNGRVTRFSAIAPLRVLAVR